MLSNLPQAIQLEMKGCTKIWAQTINSRQLTALVKMKTNFLMNNNTHTEQCSNQKYTW